MKWQYKTSLLLLILAQIVFFALTIYHTDSAGDSWILYHQSDYIWSFILSLISLGFFIYGLATEKSNGDKWNADS